MIEQNSIKQTLKKQKSLKQEEYNDAFNGLSNKSQPLSETHTMTELDGGVTFGTRISKSNASGSTISEDCGDDIDNLTLHPVLGRIYDISFDEYTTRSISNKFTEDEHVVSLLLSVDDHILIKDVKIAFDNMNTDHKALKYLLSYGLYVFQHDKYTIVKKLVEYDNNILHTPLKNTIRRFNSISNGSLLSEDSTKKCSIKLGERFVGAISELSRKLNVTQANMFRILLYCAVEKIVKDYPEESRLYSKQKLEMFDDYILEKLIMGKLAINAGNKFIELKSIGWDKIREEFCR
jgi:hypothetical protein